MGRRRLLAGIVGLVASAGVATTASAATVTIGAVNPVVSTFDCSACTSLQVGTDPASPSYVVPPLPASGNAWTLTSFSVRGTNDDGTARALIWRHTASPGEFRLIASTPDAQIPQGTAPNIPASIPVQPGDVLGIRSGSNVDPIYDTASDGDMVLGAFGTDPVVGQTIGLPTSDNPSMTSTRLRLNIAATLSSPDPVTPIPQKKKKKCKKKKKHHRSAESAKKKKCKKRKKR
jgi:hypothetical protein